MKLRLQMYDDSTFGYLGYDGNETSNFTTNARVVATQKEDESREEFIQKNNITFSPNQYGSVEANDNKIINSEDLVKLADKNYAMDKILEYANTPQCVKLAKAGYFLEKLIYVDRPKADGSSYYCSSGYIKTAALARAIKDNRTDLIETVSKFDDDSLPDDSKTLLLTIGYYKKTWIDELGYGAPAHILAEANETNRITDAIYNNCIKAFDADYDPNEIKELKRLGYDVSVFKKHKDPKLRYVVFDDKDIDEFVDDRSSTVRGKVYSIWSTLSDEEKTSFIILHIKEIVKREKSYFKIMEYAIDHNMFTDYILENTKSDEFRDKIILGEDFVSSYIDVDKLKKYHLNNEVAHMPEYRGQGHFTLSQKALKNGKLELCNTSDGSLERIAVNGPKVRGDGQLGCRDGIYYKCLVTPDNNTPSTIRLTANQSIYIHEAVFTRHAIDKVHKGLFEEE